MNKNGRLENSIKNSMVGVLVQAMSTIMGMVTRSFFIHYLSAEYLGVNGLFSNVLTMLSLAELGVGSAITYSMYKPIADRDEHKIAQLMNLYRTAYQVVGTTVAIVGICIIPFLKFLIRGNSGIDNLTVIYLLFLSNTVFSYFFAYKKSVFSADQYERVLYYFNLAAQVIRYTFQIIAIYLFRSFIVYLVIQVLATLMENVTISIFANYKYPFLLKYKNERLSKSETGSIFKNIKALFIYKIGSTVLDGTDNIIISAFDGIISVGVLSNYSLITGSLQAFLSKISNALTGSVGNYVAKESDKNKEKLLNNITFLHFVLYGMFFVGCMGVFKSFITIWAGENYLLSDKIVFVHCFNIYINGMMNSIWIFRSTMGLFVYGKWRPLVSAVINVVVSIILAKKMGLLGVLLGTTITRLLTNVWFDPYIVFNHGLKKSPFMYYLKWIRYMMVIFFDVAVLFHLNSFLKLSGITAVIIYSLMSVLVFGCSVIVLFGRSEPYKYFENICINIINNAISSRGK